MRTKIKTYEALSMNNGIIFYSKRHKGYATVATINEEGSITTEWTTIKKYKKEKNKNEENNEVKVISLFELGILLFVITFIILLDWLTDKNPLYGLRFALISFSIISISTFMKVTYTERKQKNSYKFHSAEHMVLNAYRKLKRVPSLEEIHQYSRFSNYCGTNKVTDWFMSFTLMFVCSFIPNLLYMIIAMIAVNVIVWILIHCGFLNFLQLFSTITPTNRELLVAIEGMKVWLENEKREGKI